VIRKEAHDIHSLEALLFGQAGFLEDVGESTYTKELKSTYDFLKRKYHLTSLSKNQFQFFRMRPSNFPTIRMAQLAALYQQGQGLFSKLMKCQKKASIDELFKIQVSKFWKSHYTFSKESKESNKLLTSSFIDLLIINTIVPLQFTYQQSLHQLHAEKQIELLQSLQSEKNAIISKFEELNLKSKNAFESQSLLELKTNYCDQKRCLECAIGNRLLKVT
jgi:hypothetical protein